MSLTTSGGLGDAAVGATDVIKFALYLGMDLREDAHLLWIAEEAIRAPLPEHWEYQVDVSGRPVYLNTVSGIQCFEHPMDEYYRYLYLKKKLDSESTASITGPSHSIRTPSRAAQSSSASFGATKPRTLTSATVGRGSRAGAGGSRENDELRVSDLGSTNGQRSESSRHSNLQIAGLVQEQSRLRKDIDDSKSRLATLLNRAFNIQGNLKGKISEDIQAVFNPVYMIASESDTTDLIHTPAFRTEKKDILQSKHDHEMDLRDAEAEIADLHRKLHHVPSHDIVKLDNLRTALGKMERKRRSLIIDIKRMQHSLDERARIDSESTVGEPFGDENPFVDIPFSLCTVCRSLTATRCKTHGECYRSTLPDCANFHGDVQG